MEDITSYSVFTAQTQWNIIGYRNEVTYDIVPSVPANTKRLPFALKVRALASSAPDGFNSSSINNCRICILRPRARNDPNWINTLNLTMWDNDGNNAPLPDRTYEVLYDYMGTISTSFFPGGEGFGIQKYISINKVFYLSRELETIDPHYDWRIWVAAGRFGFSYFTFGSEYIYKDVPI